MSPPEAAKRLGVSLATLRRWSATFAALLSREAGQPAHGAARQYTEQDLAGLHQVKQLLAERLTSAQVLDRLRDQPSENLHNAASANTPINLESLQALLASQRVLLETQQATLTAQAQLIDQLQLQAGEDRARLMAQLKQAHQKVATLQKRLLRLMVIDRKNQERLQAINAKLREMIRR